MSASIALVWQYFWTSNPFVVFSL